MTTIIERSSDDSSTALVLLFVGIAAVLVIGALGLYFLRVYPFNAASQQPGAPVNIELNTQPPAPAAQGTTY